ncbi:hypothetical protein RN001_013619 [Aquatica leii]|uniref:Uncharacterized protein n=1 Tax=Aquatica leii TaxID=1421715 RepID=A0AAN7SE07_9COLE|nr:hypothetical protein RN001_013619 [Aquatica leii]
MKSLALCLIILSSYDAFKIVQDHYWREFNGLLPSDAIPGGTDETGDTTYIGQFSVVAEYNTDVASIHSVVATLYKGKDRAVAAYNGRAVYSNETSNLKVLCAGYMGRYKWFNPKSLFAPNCRFVTGGNEDGIHLYVGKATEGREKLIGKIFSDTSFHTSKLTAPHQGGEMTYDSYEILTYCY